jgi:hypothetical protein
MFKSKKILLIVILIQSLLVSCGPTLEMIQSTNRSNLNKISLGMTKSEVLNIMGTKTISSFEGSIINSPYRSETTTHNGINYEIHFFYTDTKKSDNSITDDELTPVVYLNGKVVGYGWSYLKENIKKYQLDIR